MTFIVIEVQTNADGTVGNIVTSYTDRNLAEQKYHMILASAAIIGANAMTVSAYNKNIVQL